MLHYSVKPIRLVLRRSVLLAAFIMAASASAIVVVLCMPVQSGLKIGTCLAIVAAAGFHFAQHAWLLLPWSCREIALDSKGRLQLMRQDGKSVDAAVLPDCFVSAYLTILNVRLDSGKRSSVILPTDRVDADGLRQLRVWLRWGRHHWRDQVLPEEVR